MLEGSFFDLAFLTRLLKGWQAGKTRVHQGKVEMTVPLHQVASSAMRRFAFQFYGYWLLTIEKPNLRLG